LIYFNRELQNRVLGLFRRSLIHRGFMGLGSKESIRFSPAQNQFEQLDPAENLFQLKADL
jgi:chemotaxis protein methyltransferase CheR